MALRSRILKFLFWTCAFAAAYTQAPLYFSNQNQYFLHGLAEAGRGRLGGDWLSKTASPTPAFDALVTLTARYGHEFLFHAYYALLLGVYWSSLTSLAAFITGDRFSPGQRLGFVALLVGIHSAVLRWLSYRFFDADYACFAQGWFAAQYVLGPVLQPSAFGVFFLVAIERFVRGRRFAAHTALGVTCIVHPTYLLHAGILTLAFAGIAASQKKWWSALLLPMWSLLLVSPVLIHSYSNFAPTDPTAFEEAQRILVEIRIPHHCLPRRWFDAIAALQIGLMAAGIFAVRRTPLFPVLLALFTASSILTIAQWVTGSHSLALLFPWRSSAILIPIATAVLLARLVLVSPRFWESRFARLGSAGGIAALCVGGIAIMTFRGAYPVNAAEVPLMDFVRTHAKPGDLYLLPVTVPDLQKGRGSNSGDFKPSPPLTGDRLLIPVDFQQFRLETGTPIYTDFKAIPYKDADVLEWYGRVMWNRDAYQSGNWNDPHRLAELRSRGITHVVTARDRGMFGNDFEAIYGDRQYNIHRIER